VTFIFRVATNCTTTAYAFKHALTRITVAIRSIVVAYRVHAIDIEPTGMRCHQLVAGVTGFVTTGTGTSFPIITDELAGKLNIDHVDRLK